MTDLNKIRQDIDTIDDKIIDLIAKRNELVQAVGKYKFDNDLPSRDEQRWQKVLTSRIRNAQKKKINPKFAKELYELIHEFSVMEEDIVKLNNSKIDKIVIHGFRATGKTTGSKKLIQRLNPAWTLIDTDEEVTKRSKQTISELTKAGEDWYTFRKLESEVFEELLGSDEKIIIATGGGTCVNDFFDQRNETSYGERNRNTLKKYSKKAISVVLTAKEEVILKYVEEKERHKLGSRPNLNSDLAKKINQESKNLTKEGKENLIIKTLLEETKKTYQKRKPTYNLIVNSKIIDTSYLSDDEIADKILESVLVTLDK